MNIEPSKDDRELADRILATLHNSNEMDHVAAAKVIAEWNTRPQPAPPEGEPDAIIAELKLAIANAVEGDDPGSVVSVPLVVAQRILDRLSLAARPKVEDAEDSNSLKDERDFARNLAAEHYKRAEAAESKLAEREAELAKADAVINWFDDYCGPSFRELAGEILIAKFEAVIGRHAARQQQKS